MDRAGRGAVDAEAFAAAVLLPLTGEATPPVPVDPVESAVDGLFEVLTNCKCVAIILRYGFRVAFQ